MNGRQLGEQKCMCALCSLPQVFPRSAECVFCDRCDGYWCLPCGVRFHDGYTCADYKAFGTPEGAQRAAEADAKFEEYLREFNLCRALGCAASNWPRAGQCGGKIKRCPNSACRITIDKTEGCNAMRCHKCTTAFCWLCLAIAPGGDAHGHFNEPGRPCFMKLFEGVYN